MKQFVIAMLISFVVATTAAAQRKAPLFSLKTADGKVVELAKLKGKVVVVNFWATWCGPCRAEIPAFLEVYQQYKEKGLEIVGISVDDDGWGAVKPFVAKYKITYPIVVDNNKVARSFGDLSAIPTTFVIDKQGMIVERHVGSMNKRDFEDLIKPHLN
ncbi:MAG: TlpA family protein disulfide reductase [Ignavibacteriales bacterium]|nr:TlpA family protein disulfide reductase [Ignavibacteriales bacterium]